MGFCRQSNLDWETFPPEVERRAADGNKVKGNKRDLDVGTRGGTGKALSSSLDEDVLHLTGCRRWCTEGGSDPPAAMAVSAWQALSPLQWARWGWDTLLGWAGDGDSPGSDPALGLLQRLSWGSRHDNLIRPAGEPIRHR